MTTVEFKGDGDKAIEYGPPVVYTRANWADAWIEDTTIQCVHATWSTGRSFSTATLVRYYGRFQSYVDEAPEIRDKDPDMPKRFVKIKIPTEKPANSIDYEYREWFGVMDLVEDDQHGVELVANPVAPGDPPTFSAIANGVQTVTCFGMEKLLAESPITNSYFLNGTGSVTELKRGLATNKGEKWNASVLKHFSLVTGFSSYLFDSRETSLGTMTPWTTADVVEYLLANHTPVDKDGVAQIKYFVDVAKLPAWDRPTVNLDGNTVFDLLNELIGPKHMLTWRVSGVSEITNWVILEVISMTRETITLEPVNANYTPSLEPNAHIIQVVSDRDQATTVSIKDTGIAKFDQVIFRGPRKRSVFTVSIADGTLDTMWGPFTGGGNPYQDRYEAGASADASYAGASLQDQAKLNGVVRSDQSLDNVFSRFGLGGTTWNGEAGDGEGGTALVYVFPDGAGGNETFYFQDLYFESNLPLIRGIDYSGDAVATGVHVFDEYQRRQEIEPLVFFKAPGTSRWIAGDKISVYGLELKINGDENNSFSVSFQTDREAAKFWLKVSGDHQHAIAYTDFTPLDADEPCGQWDYRDACVTVSCLWDAHVEGRYPADEDLPDGDVVRRKVIEVGDEYSLTYVAPNTVVGVDETSAGALKRSTGGWIPSESDVKYPPRVLESAAKVAFTYWGRSHKLLGIRTHRLLSPSKLDVGFLIQSIGDFNSKDGHYQELDVVITQISIAWPVDEKPQAPTMTIETGFAELDPIRAARR